MKKKTFYWLVLGVQQKHEEQTFTDYKIDIE